MEISGSSGMGQLMFASQVSIAVQKLTMEQTEQSSDAIRQMMEQSVTPYLGSNFDMKG